jgi:cytochrome c biogenesis protein CcmG/thiol:disulfide interchange protein DsbE
VNWKRAIIAMLAAAPVIALFAYGFTRDPAEIPSPLPGHAAPTFSLAVFTSGEARPAPPVGDTIRLRDLRGKVLVVNFWASWCGPCRSEHAALSETARQYAGRPVQFIGVLYNDRPESALQWIAEMGGQSYPAVLDPRTLTAIDYGVYGVPETYFIDATGRILYKQLGPASEAVLHRWIDSLLPGAKGVDSLPHVSR